MATKQRKSVDDAQTRTSRRLNVRIDDEAYTRLMVHCVMDRKDPGEILNELIEQHLKNWALPATQAKRSASSRHEDRREITDHVMESVAA